jgi:hypothetical protein
LGVYVRGTDYNFAKGHNRQPAITEVINAIDEFLLKYEMIEGIYLATEEQTILNYFVSRYSQKIYYQKKKRIEYYSPGQTISPTSSVPYLKEEIILQGREYLADIEILSRLKFFISGLNNGSAAVIEKNGNNFVDSRVFYEGIQ